MFNSEFEDIRDIEDNKKISLDQIKIIDLKFRRKKRTLIRDCFNENLLKNLRKKLGCGGNLSKIGLELQGDFVKTNKLKKILESQDLLL